MKTPTLTFEFLNQPAASSQKINLRIDKKEFQILTEDGSCIIDEVEFVKIIDLNTEMSLPVVAAPQPTTTATPRKGMPKFLSRIVSRLSVLPLTLPLYLVLLLGVGNVWGQTYYDMSSGNYSQNFADMANWTNNYAAGTGASNWKVAATATGSSVSAGTVFASSTSGGVQKGTQSLIILATGNNSSATDLLLNFSGRTAGILSLDWVKVVNTANASPRSSDLKIQYSTDGGSNFTDITGYTIPRILNNSTAESGSLSSITLPSALNNQSTVVLRFYVWNNSQTGGSGNRPKWQLDNISVTSTAAATAPAAPTISSITPGNQQLSVAFTAGSDGGSAITNYKYSTNGGTHWQTRSSGTTASPLVISTLSTDGSTALTNGTSYNVQIRAVNTVGDGTATASTAATPRTTPSAPTITGITPGNQQLSVAFTAGSDGGSSITTFKYSTNGGANWQTRSAGTTASPLAISTLSTDGTTALTNGVSYDIQIRAVNAAGDGTASSTTSGTPAAPVSPTLNAVTLSSSLTSTYGTASTGVSFTASGSNLTGNITATAQSGYEVSTSLGSGYDVSVSVASGTTVYVRFASTISAGNKDNATAVVLSGGGASSSANVATSSSGNAVSQKALTVSGLTAQNKVYDGLTTATATGTAALSGVVSPDAVSLTGTPTFTFVNATVGTSKTVNTTNYSLTGAQASNYTLTQPTLSANITVRSLTITANDVSKVQGVLLTGGAGSTAFTSSGLQNSETIGSITITYGSARETSGDGNTVGVYASQVTPSAAIGGTFTESNYSISYVAGSITVTAAPVVIAIQDFETSPASPTWAYSGGGGTDNTASRFNGGRSYRIAGSQTLTMNNFNIAGYSDAVLSVAFAATGVDNDDDLFMDISYDNGSTWTGAGSIKLVDGFSNASININTTSASNPTTVGSNPWTTAIGASETQISVRFRNVNSTSTEYYWIDDVKVTGVPIPTAPILSTPTATSITTNSATLGATITSDGGATITSRGTVYKTSSPVLSSDNASAEGGTSTGAFTQSRSSLSPQTRYFYAGYAVNSIGTGLSAEGNFRTLSNPPSSQATGLSATSISSTQIDLSISTAATFPGSGATQGGYLVIYSSSGSPTLASTNGQAPSAGVGSIFSTNATNLPSTPSTSISVTGLSSSNTYNFLVIPYTWDGVNAATYNYLTTSAPTANATTSAGTPTLNSPTVSNITATSATLGATVTSNGGSSLTARGTVFKTSSPVLSTDNALSEGGTTVSSYSHTRSSLSPQTLYYFAGYASNSEGTGLSGEGSFRTLSNPPSSQASSLNATASSSSQIDLNLTGATFPGSGATQAGYVVIYATGTPTFTASNGQAPAAGVGNIFTTSATILPSNPFTTVNITGLNATTNYNFLIVPYTWDGTNTTTYHYLTTGALTASATTFNPTAGLQLSSTNTAYIIDFDNTVSGVNSGSYSGTGFAPSPSSGQLDSDAWATTGMSDGSSNFGSSSTTGDFARGNNSGGISSTAGFYSFTVSTGNRAFGIQPTSAEWTPGTVTLRVQNQTGASLSNLSLSYRVWIINDQDMSNTFNFSHSSDNSTYTAVSSLNLSSTAAAEGTPTWKSYTRVVSISGLNIPNSGYYYLRWTGDDVSGSGSRDEFALDDITVIANPSTTYHSLSGTSQELIIDGNTSLGGNITISGTTSLTSGTLTIGANTLTINGAISLGSGNIDASNASATVVFGGSTAQTIPASTFTGNINNLTLNNSAGLTTNQALTVNGNLTLTSGDLTIGATNLTLGSASAISSASASSHIVATSTGEVRKIYGDNGSFTFPVGDGTNYTPATINFTTGSSLSGATDDYVGVRLKTTKVTGMNSGNINYINRSWFIEPGAGLSSYSYTVNLTYAQGDVVGTESEIRPVKLSSGVWQYPGNANFDFGTQLANTLGEINEITNVLSWSGLTSFSEFGGGGQGGPLPVELLSFNATCENDQNILTWQTASEHNSLYFDIEKSRDGQTWNLIDQQVAAGNSNELLSYQFVDAEKNNATVYYRLNQVDIDGKNEYFGPIAVSCNTSKFITSTSPNPSKGMFYLMINSVDDKIANYAIRDINGMIIKSEKLELEKGINAFLINEKFPTGAYFIEIITETGKSKILKHFNF
jgi:predicted RNA-binding protein with TRAM domain